MKTNRYVVHWRRHHDLIAHCLQTDLVAAMFWPMPPQSAATRRPSTQRRALGVYTPRQFTPRCRERFLRDRRQRYLSRIDGKPTDQQSALIMSMARLEWSALEAEAEGGMTAFREGRELRRLFLRALADFERSVQPAAARPTDPLDAIRAFQASFDGGEAA
jgi:hypothetical protein